LGCEGSSKLNSIIASHGLLYILDSHNISPL